MLLDLAELIIAFFQYLYLALSAPQVTYPKAWDNTGYAFSVLALGKDIFGAKLDFFVSDQKVFFTVISVVLPLVLIFLGLIALNPKRNVLWFFALLIGLLFLMAGIAARLISNYVGTSITENEAINMIVIGCLFILVCVFTFVVQRLTGCCEPAVLEEEYDEDGNPIDSNLNGTLDESPITRNHEEGEADGVTKIITIGNQGTMTFPSPSSGGERRVSMARSQRNNSIGGITTLLTREETMKRETRMFSWTDQIESLAVFAVLLFLGLVFIEVIPSTDIGLDRVGLGGNAVLKVLFPIGIVLLILSVASLAWASLSWFARGRQWRWKVTTVVETNAMWALLILMSLLYMPITSAVFVMFNCNPLTCYYSNRIVDEGSVLVPFSTDPYEGCMPCFLANNQVCPLQLANHICAGSTESRLESSVDVPCSRMQQYFFPAAGILIAAYIVGLPLLFFRIIQQSAGLVRAVVPAAPGAANDEERWESQLSSTTNVAKFLYQPTYYRFRFLRLYEILRRFITTIVSTYIFRTSFSSGYITIYVSLGVHTATVLLFSLIQPHIDAHENRTVIACSATLVVFLVFAAVALDDPESLPGGVYIAVLVVAMIVPAVCLAYGLFLWWRKRQSATVEQALLDAKQMQFLVHTVEEETSTLAKEEWAFIEAENARLRARAEERRNRKLFELEQLEDRLRRERGYAYDDDELYYSNPEDRGEGGDDMAGFEEVDPAVADGFGVGITIGGRGFDDAQEQPDREHTFLDNNDDEDAAAATLGTTSTTIRGLNITNTTAAGAIDSPPGTSHHRPNTRNTAGLNSRATHSRKPSISPLAVEIKKKNITLELEDFLDSSSDDEAMFTKWANSTGDQGGVINFFDDDDNDSRFNVTHNGGIGARKSFSANPSGDEANNRTMNGTLRGRSAQFLNSRQRRRSNAPFDLKGRGSVSPSSAGLLPPHPPPSAKAAGKGILKQPSIDLGNTARFGSTITTSLGGLGNTARGGDLLDEEMTSRPEPNISTTATVVIEQPCAAEQETKATTAEETETPVSNDENEHPGPPQPPVASAASQNLPSDELLAVRQEDPEPGEKTNAEQVVNTNAVYEDAVTANSVAFKKAKGGLKINTEPITGTSLTRKLMQMTTRFSPNRKKAKPWFLVKLEKEMEEQSITADRLKREADEAKLKAINATPGRYSFAKRNNSMSTTTAATTIATLATVPTTTNRASMSVSGRTDISGGNGAVHVGESKGTSSKSVHSPAADANTNPMLSVLSPTSTTQLLGQEHERRQSWIPRTGSFADNSNNNKFGFGDDTELPPAMVKTTQPVIINIQRKIPAADIIALRRSSLSVLASGIVVDHMSHHQNPAKRAKGRGDYERQLRRKRFRNALIETIRNENNNQAGQNMNPSNENPLAPVENGSPDGEAAGDEEVGVSEVALGIAGFVKADRRRRKPAPNPLKTNQNQSRSKRKEKKAVAPPPKKVILPNNEVEQCFLILFGGAQIEDVAEHRFAYGKELQIAVARDADIRINKIVQKTFNLWLMLAGFLGFVALGFSFMGLLDNTEKVVEDPNVWSAPTIYNEFVGYTSWENFTQSCCCVAYAIPIHSQEGSQAVLDLFYSQVGNTTSLANSREARPSGAEGAKERYTNSVAKVEKWVCSNGRVKERIRALRRGDFSSHPNIDSFVISPASASANLPALTGYELRDTTASVRNMCGVSFLEPGCQLMTDYTGKITFEGCNTITNEYLYLW